MSFHFLFFSPQHNPPVCIHNCYSFPLTEELQSAIIHREAHNDFLATQTAVLSHTRAQTHKNRSCCFIAVSLQQLLSWGRSTEDWFFFFFALFLKPCEHIVTRLSLWIFLYAAPLLFFCFFFRGEDCFPTLSHSAGNEEEVGWLSCCSLPVIEKLGERVSEESSRG